jgi:hypothetical protein
MQRAWWTAIGWLLLNNMAWGSDFLMVRPLMDSPQPITPAGTVVAPGSTGGIRQFFQNVFGSAPAPATAAPTFTPATPAPALATTPAAPSVTLPTAPAYTTPAVAPPPTYGQPIAVAPPVVTTTQPPAIIQTPASRSCCPLPMCNPSNNCSPTQNWPGVSPQTTYGTPTWIAPGAMVPQTVIIRPAGM